MVIAVTTGYAPSIGPRTEGAETAIPLSPVVMERKACMKNGSSSKFQCCSSKMALKYSRPFNRTGGVFCFLTVPFENCQPSSFIQKTEVKNGFLQHFP